MKIAITENRAYDPIQNDIIAYASINLRGVQINNIQIAKWLSPLTWRVIWPHYRNGKGHNQTIVQPSNAEEKALIESQILHQVKIKGLK